MWLDKTLFIMNIAHCYLDGNVDAMEFCLQDSYHHVLAAFTYNLQQDRYQKVEKSMAEMPMDENKISITSQGRVSNYVTYAMTLLQFPHLRPFYLLFH
ncbi:hypothetical protein AHAS_Ahas13G0223900 [Arachis hypogaea]